MRVLIFTEAGRDVGLGHLSRCSSLYDELDKRGIFVEFVIHSDERQFDLLANKRYVIANWLSEDFLRGYIRQDDACIVDSYLADKNVYEVISSQSKRALFIDDNGRLDYPDGIVVNPALSTEAVRYPQDANCYLLGADYVILRKPFVQAKRQEVAQEVENVLITMGGADIHNLTPQILELLSERYKQMFFHVVIGNGFQNVENIKACVRENVVLHQNASAEEMKTLMLAADMAITAAGQTIYELIATGTPFIPIQVVDNQANNVAALEKFNLVQTTLQHNDTVFSEKLINEFKRLLGGKLRQDVNKTYTQLIDGRGAERIIASLLAGDIT